jgi:hypothetical protein
VLGPKRLKPLLRIKKQQKRRTNRIVRLCGLPERFERWLDRPCPFGAELPANGRPATFQRSAGAGSFLPERFGRCSVSPLPLRCWCCNHRNIPAAKNAAFSLFPAPVKLWIYGSFYGRTCPTSRGNTRNETQAAVEPPPGSHFGFNSPASPPGPVMWQPIICTSSPSGQYW